MSAKVYVGNLSWNTTDELLRDAFAQYGTVVDVRCDLIACMFCDPCGLGCVQLSTG